jgi:type IV pilus biogenesis protein PilP
MTQTNNNSNGKRSKIVLILFILVLVFLGYLLIKLFNNRSAPIADQQKAIEKTALVKIVDQEKLSNNLKSRPEKKVNEANRAEDELSTVYNNRSNELSLAKINTALLAEQAAQQKLKAQIAQSESQMGILMHPYVNSNAQPMSSSTETREVKPAVIWIATKGDQVMASIRQSNNKIVTIHEGMIFPDGTRVRTIGKDNVILVKGEKIQQLILPPDYYE